MNKVLEYAIPMLLEKGTKGNQSLDVSITNVEKVMKWVARQDKEMDELIFDSIEEVYNVLTTEVSDATAKDLINLMQNKGILFRKRR